MLILAALALHSSNANPVLFALERRYGIQVRQGDAPTSAFVAVKFKNLEAADAGEAKAYAFVLASEISKYPLSLLKASGLKQIALVKHLTLSDVEVGAVGDYKQEILYVDPFVARGHDSYRRHIVHHDFFHLLDEQLNGSAYFKDERWMSLNTPGFSYGNGGIHAREATETVFKSPAPGFINRYAMSGIEEDRAEVFAVLFVAKNWAQVSPIAEADPIVSAKVKLMRDLIRGIAPDFHGKHGP